jgi:rod shape-determining protein MreC
VYNRRRARILLAVLVLAALILVTVDFRSDGREGEGPLGQLRAGASAVFGPIQDGLSTIMRPVANSLANVGGLFDARSENVQLRAQLERLQERRLSYEDVLRENEQLRQLLDIQQRSTLDTVAAQVIASGPSNFEWTITLDVGTNDGVQRNMPVITGDGLVGGSSRPPPTPPGCSLPWTPASRSRPVTPARARSARCRATAATP